MIQQVVLADKADKSGIDEEIKITFRTTKGLLRELKHYAADNDMTVTDILNQACKDFLSRAKAKK
jgi:hypothetical protein